MAYPGFSVGGRQPPTQVLFGEKKELDPKRNETKRKNWILLGGGGGGAGGAPLVPPMIKLQSIVKKFSKLT